MKHILVKLIPVFLLIGLFLAACSPTNISIPPTASASPTMTNTLAPTATSTPTMTSTPTQTLTPTGTPTPTQIPEELRNKIVQSYGTVLLIQASLELLDETAHRVQSGDLSGFESFGALIAIAAFVNALDEAIPEITPPQPIDQYWEDILTVHEEIKSILSQWFNQEIDSSVVINEVEPLIKDLDNVITSIEDELAEQYNVTSEEMAYERQKIMEEIRDVFETPEASSVP